MSGGLYALVGRLRESLRSAEAGTLTDAELLGRWAAEQDQAAFELLVWRHGRLVSSVCRRMLCRPEDVEDAFQATFLVLARKAGTLRRGQALASWLHTVASRIALEARQRGSRRRQAGYPLEEIPARADPPGNELREVIDEEVGRLPEKYRQAFVLCCLEGRTNEEAARELGRPLGTVLSQLSRARQRLRQRLARRGLGPAALLGLAEAPVPAGLIAQTAEAAVVVTGKNLAAGAVKASVAALMEGALRGMFIAKFKFAAAVVLSVAVLGAGGGAVGYRALSAGEPGSEGDATRSVQNNKEVEELRNQLKKAEAQIAELSAALRRAQAAPRGGSTPRAEEKPTAGGKVSRPTPAVDREDVELMKVRADARKADLDASKALLEEAKRRLDRMDKLAASAAVSAEEVGAARVTVTRYQAEVRLKEAELQEALIHLKRAERLYGASRPAAGTPTASLEQRVKALEGQLAEMKKELDRVRAELKAGKSGL